MTYFNKINIDLLHKSQFYSEDKLRELRTEGLLDLLEQARLHTKYYKKLLKIKEIEELDQVPILTKDLIHNQFKELTADNIENREKWTGGTSQQVVIKSPANSTPLYAGKERFMEWQGLKNIKEACLWGQGELQHDLGIIEPKIIGNTLYMPIEQLRSRKDALSYLKMIEEFKPNKFRGYPSALTLLAYYAMEKKKRYQPEIIESNCEPLTPYKKKMIEEAFNAPVYVFYGSQDLGSMAQDCSQHEGLHLFAERYILEVTKEGRFLWTDLLNYAMPLIRYENGDSGKILKTKCSCGRVLPLLDETLGRTLYFLWTSTDEWINVTEIHEHMYFDVADYLKLVDRHQVIQEEQGKCVLILKPWDLTKKPDMTCILERFKKYGLDIEVKWTTSLQDFQLSKSGKQLSVVTKFTPPWLGKETELAERM